MNPKHLLNRVLPRRGILLKIILGTVLLTIIIVNITAGQAPPISPPGGGNMG
ncbi:MAG: hypothetical protein JSW11_08860 [Candidatus Heimdallarchaeota archaeon]|nr:MAG: hypothetical protein JSW11_08860 [Candidatus Heimdallarchaeota archaeon]